MSNGYLYEIDLIVKIKFNNDKQKNTNTRYSDDKQSQFPESILQDHRVVFVKLIRHVYQQGLGTF